MYVSVRNGRHVIAIAWLMVLTMLQFKTRGDRKDSIHTPEKGQQPNNPDLLQAQEGRHVIAVAWFMVSTMLQFKTRGDRKDSIYTPEKGQQPNNPDLLQAQDEPSHENMAPFVLRKIILQTRMRSHPLGQDVWFLVGPFVYFNTSCERTMKTLAKLRGCVNLPGPSLVAFVISAIIS